MRRTILRQKTGSVSFSYRAGALLLALCFCLLFWQPAAAEQAVARVPAGGVDLQRTGSVLVTVTGGDGKPVSGGTLRLYSVARIEETNGEQGFALTEAFAGWSGSTDDLFTDRSCAESLTAYVEDSGVQSNAETAPENGSAAFDGLAPGAYLIMQSEGAAGYEAMPPFLAVLPQALDGELIYDVTAQAKPVEPLPPGEQVFEAEKIVEVRAGTAPQDTVFSFVLSAETPDSPLPDNTEAVYIEEENAMIVSRKGEGSVRFGRLAFTQADAGKTYLYAIRETQGTAPHYTYDKTTYRLTVSVTDPGEGDRLAVSSVLTDANGNAVTDVVFRNLYDGGDTPQIPRTGQLWWPVIVMAPAGLVLAVFGAALLRRGGKEEDPE